MQKMKEDPMDRHIVEACQKRMGRDKGTGKERNPSDGMKTEARKDDEGKIEIQQILEAAVMNLTNSKMDVAEVYSPERVTITARNLGFNAGWSLDFTTADENCRFGDLECAHMKNKAVRKLLGDKPKLLIGGSMCIDFCSWVHVNHPEMAAEVAQERLRKGEGTFGNVYEIIGHTDTSRSLSPTRTSTKCNVMEGSVCTEDVEP